eukprot:2745037-Pyramimonas_sp.AAC.1
MEKVGEDNWNGSDNCVGGEIEVAAVLYAFLVEASPPFVRALPLGEGDGIIHARVVRCRGRPGSRCKVGPTLKH